MNVDWAVAFERATGWPTHVIHVNRSPLRVYCEDDGRWTFDVRGIIATTAYGPEICGPLAEGRDWPDSAYLDGPRRRQLKIAFGCVGEDRLGEYGLSPDERLVAECLAAIRSNAAYMALVPERPEPRASARDLARYSFSGCVVYAEALARLISLPAVTMTATRMVPGVETHGEGFHEAVLHPDGTLEDVWGRFPAERVAARYGMAEWEISPEPHARMLAEALRTRPGAEGDVHEAMRVAEALRRSAPAR